MSSGRFVRTESPPTGERTIKCIFYEIEVILLSKCLHTMKMLFSCTKCDYSSCQLYVLEHTCKCEFNLLLNNYDIKILLCEIFHAGEKPCYFFIQYRVKFNKL